MKRILISLALLITAVSAAAGTYVISTNADSGPGSLRQGILDANSGACSSPCRINYGSRDLISVEPLTPLPDITANGVGISAEPPGYSWSLEISGKKLSSGSGLHFRGSTGGVSGVIINGFPGSGVVIEDAVNVHVGGCVIGLDATGTRPIPNGQNGVTIVRGSNISVDTSTIGGNGGNGVYVTGTTDVFFGLDVIGKQYLPQGSGEIKLPNAGSGIVLVDVQRAHLLGNTIVNNALGGVVTGGSSSGIQVEDIGLPTLIYNNGLLAIDIGFDGVTEPRPVLSLAELNNGFMRVKGEVHTTPDTTVSVNVFASDALAAFNTAEAKTALSGAKVKSDAAGVATFEIRFPMAKNLAGQWISASATTPAGTQELSAPIQAVVNNQNFTVVNSSDSGAGALRQAILDANASPCAADFPCLINFSGDVRVVSPLSQLPPISRSGIVVDGQKVVTIDGSRSSAGAGLTISAQSENVVAAGIRRITISGFRGDGVVIDAAEGFYVLNPVVFDSTIAGNTGAGIRVSGNIPFVHIGTFSSGNRLVLNVVRGNSSHGVALQGGFFELDANNIASNGGSGVYIESTALAHLERNTIAFNGQAGVSTASTDPIAFKGVIQNSIHSNVGRAVELRDVLQTTDEKAQQTPPEITSATYDPVTQTGTITGFFTRVAVPNGWWLPVIDFATSTFPEIGERGSMETPLYVNYSTKEEGNERYSFRGTTLQVDLRGKRISATATPFVFEGFKGPPQDNVFGQGYVYGTTSEVSKAVPIVTTGCTAEIPKIESATAVGTTVTFRWSGIAGATGYNIWLRDTPGTPHSIANAIGTTATVSVDPGAYEWFVEATFSGCPPMKSEAVALEVGSSGRHRAAGR
jgi:hypothetical protein